MIYDLYIGDILLGDTNNSSMMKQTIPLYACNSDIVYMESHEFPRYTQGAFLHAFKALFENYSNVTLDINLCGKPYPLQYSTAEEMIIQHAKTYHTSISSNSNSTSDADADADTYKYIYVPTLYYGIGDNPKADIRGANNAGNHWKSVLVRTGVFQGINDDHDVADIVADDIASALDVIFAKHNI